MKEAVMNIAVTLKMGNKSLTQAVQEAMDAAKRSDSTESEKNQENKSEEEKKDGKETK